MEPRLLAIESVGTPPGSILRCAGEIDLANVEELRRALARSIWIGLPAVDVDLVQITFLDSSAIRALFEAQRELASRNSSLRVIAGPPSARLLRLLGLDGVLQLTEVAISEGVPAAGSVLAHPSGLLDESPFSDGETPCEPAAVVGYRPVMNPDRNVTDVRQLG